MPDPSLPPAPASQGRARSRPPSQTSATSASASNSARPRRARAIAGDRSASLASHSAAAASSSTDGQLSASQKATMAGALALGGLVLVAGILAWRSSRTPKRSKKKSRSRRTTAASSALSPPPGAHLRGGGASSRPMASAASRASPSASRWPPGPAQSSRPVPRSRGELALSIKNEGNLLYSQKDHVNAIRKYSEALRYADEDTEFIGKILGNRVLAYLQLKKFQEAYRDADEMARLDPMNPRAYQLRGISLQELEEFEKATEDFRKAVDIYPLDNKGRGKCMERLKGLEAILEKRSQKSDDLPSGNGPPQEMSPPVVTEVTADSVSTPEPPYKILERPASSSPKRLEPEIPYKTVVFSASSGSDEAADSDGKATGASGGDATNDGEAANDDATASSESSHKEVMPQTHTFDDVMGVGGGSVDDVDATATAVDAAADAEESAQPAFAAEVEADESIDLRVNGQKIPLHSAERKSAEPTVDEADANTDDDEEEVDLSQSSLLSRSDANWQVVRPADGSDSSTSGANVSADSPADASASPLAVDAEAAADDTSNVPTEVNDSGDFAAELSAELREEHFDGVGSEDKENDTMDLTSSNGDSLEAKQQ